MLRTAFRAVCLATVALLSTSATYGAVTNYLATLAGPSENPPNPSPGNGTVLVTYDSTAHTLSVNATFSGLVGNTTAAHIHCCVAPPGNAAVAVHLPSLSGFPLGVTSGVLSNTYDLTQATSFNPTFVASNGGTLAGAEAALANGLSAGQAYFNIHSTVYPGGEIRGFLEAHANPVPALSPRGLAAAALLLALAGLLALRRH